MSSISIQNEYLLDTYGLLFLNSRELRNLLVLILSKYKMHITPITLIEFLSYIHYKCHDHLLTDQVLRTMTKLYVVENLDEEVMRRASMIISDLLKHHMEYNISDVLNVSVALVRNLTILTDNPSTYVFHFRYGVSVQGIRDFVKDFERSSTDS